MGYRPRIVRGSGGSAAIYDLPLPVRQHSFGYSRRVSTAEVPTQPGVIPGITAKGAATINLNGVIMVGNPQDADRTGDAVGVVTNLLDEQDLMYAVLIDTNEPFWYYRYVAGATVGGVEYNPLAGTRVYKNCFCNSLNIEATPNPHLFSYTMSILVPDGTEWKIG